MSEKETIQPGKYFELTYKLLRVNADGTETLVHEVEADEPDCAVMGSTMGFVKALEDAIAGMSAGDKFDFIAKPEDAFGPYDPDEVISLPRERFTVDGKFDEKMFTPGALIPLMTGDGFRIDGLVNELTDTDVVLDFNHPLAKDSVHYIGEVTLVREPTDEELQAGSGCGCGGGCCGGDGDCNCDGGCGGGCGNCQ